VTDSQDPGFVTLQSQPAGPFSLAASRRFLEGFAPAGHDANDEHDHVHLAFPVERDWTTVNACVRQTGGRVVFEVRGDVDRQLVGDQLARIFSLDIDGTGFADVGDRDPVVADLQTRYPGLRPVCFWSAYEAAAWAVVSHRVRITQAATVKQRLAERLGARIDVHGEPVAAFPAPRRLLTLGEFPGLSARKVEWLQGVASAALDGRLDSARLRALPAERAVAELRQLAGIGPFSAELILLRGAGAPDHFPSHERRLHRAMRERYGLDEAGPEELAQIAEKWRPYRTWTSVLFRVWLEDETHEIGGRPAPSTTA
jgi:DNA-3-methyladenine glycosylase II